MFIKKISPKASKSGFRRPARARAGFSLIELLLVLSLAPIIFFAVYSNFTAGVRLWQRLEVGTPEEDQVLFRVKAQRDFQNALRYASMPFVGEKDEVSFAAGIEADEALGGKRAIGRVRYFYDESAHGIMRETKDFSQAYRESAGRTVLMERDVGSFETAYLVKDPLEMGYEWKDEFQPGKPGELPIAVRLTYQTRNSPENTERTFFIPAGGSFQ